MSKVTIEDIYCTGYFKLSNIKDVEVVPRRLVEKIIEFCDRDYERFCGRHTGNTYIDGSYIGTWTQSLLIKNYAEGLLKQFEEGTDD